VSAGFSGGASASFGASAGAGFGASAGAGFSGGAGASFGTSASVGASAGATATAVSTFRASGSASAGVSASEGAFALLRAPSQPIRRSFSPTRLVLREQLPVTPAPSASFAVGGRIRGQGSAGFRADVGATARFGAGIEFEED